MQKKKRRKFSTCSFWIHVFIMVARLFLWIYSTYVNAFTHGITLNWVDFGFYVNRECEYRSDAIYIIIELNVATHSLEKTSKSQSLSLSSHIWELFRLEFPFIAPHCKKLCQIVPNTRTCRVERYVACLGAKFCKHFRCFEKVFNSI